MKIESITSLNKSYHQFSFIQCVFAAFGVFLCLCGSGDSFHGRFTPVGCVGFAGYIRRASAACRFVVAILLISFSQFAFAPSSRQFCMMRPAGVSGSGANGSGGADGNQPVTTYGHGVQHVGGHAAG